MDFRTNLARTVLCLAALWGCCSDRLAAQGASSVLSSAAGIDLFSTGRQSSLRLAGESVPENQASLSMGIQALYDDDVLASNAQRLRDEAASFDAHLEVSRLTDRMTLNFDYAPFFVLYRQSDKLDRLNHSAYLNLRYQLTPRLRAGVHDTFSYQNGVFPATSGTQLLAGPASPINFNQAVLPYTTRTLLNAPGFDVTFAKSTRTAVVFSGNYDQRQYGVQTVGQPLYNGREWSGSLQYQYRITRFTALGAFVLYQDTSYQGGAVFGYQQRIQAQSAFLYWHSQVTPSITLTLYGGPQRIHSVQQAVAPVGTPQEFEGAGGGSLTKMIGNTAFDLTVQRFVADGGGVYTAAVDTSATVGVRRRLIGRWEGAWSGVVRADTSLFQSAQGRTDVAVASVSFRRPIGSGSAFYIVYDTTHQVSKGSLPLVMDFDRNQVTIGFDFRIKAVGFGQ